MEIKTEMEKLARNRGADYFGVADLGRAVNEVTTPYEAKLISKYPFAVSVGVSIIGNIVDGLSDREDYFAAKNYHFHIYQVINPRINDITLELGRLIMSKGHNALVVPASQTVDIENLTGLFSHKMAASLAGLGWIGKSCLMITPNRGPRVRWGTVLTDAPMSADMPLNSKGCGGCRICVESCPVQAFSGKAWKVSDPRAVRMDAGKCLNYIQYTRKQEAGIEACGICVYVCPFGNKKRKQATKL